MRPARWKQIVRQFPENGMKLPLEPPANVHGTTVAVDERTIRANEPLPRCPHGRAFARPNILMFGDWGWQTGSRSATKPGSRPSWASAWWRSKSGPAWRFLRFVSSARTAPRSSFA